MAGSQQSQGQVVAALGTLLQARQLALTSGNPALGAQVMATIAGVHVAAGRGSDAMTAMAEAAELFRQAGDRPGEVRAQVQMASLQAAAGQPDAALGQLRDCQAAARTIGDGQLVAEVSAAVGQLLVGSGNVPGAIDEFRAGLAAASGLGDPSAQVQLRAFLAVAVFRGGDIVQANTLLEEDARVARAVPDAVAAAMALSVVCNALVLIQRPLDALTVGQEVLTRLTSAGAAQPQVIEATIGLANLYALADRPADAVRCAEQAVAAASQAGGPAAAVSALLQLATMAAQRDDRLAASDFLSQARQQVLASGLPEPPVLTQMLAQFGR
jgi:tetratricopeptide (TPR) repeat protein